MLTSRLSSVIVSCKCGRMHSVPDSHNVLHCSCGNIFVRDSSTGVFTSLTINNVANTTTSPTAGVTTANKQPDYCLRGHALLCVSPSCDCKPNTPAVVNDEDRPRPKAAADDFDLIAKRLKEIEATENRK